jgi:Gamma-glutamyl cyclotransferase, AIG2-like
MPLYFAYGANMSVSAMARRCPRSKPLGPARLVRHRLAVMREGWLTVARDPRSAVHGVLWDLALADVQALDRYEGLPQGLYAKLTQPVVGGQGPRQAIVYVGANAGPGAARPDYIADIIAAARSFPLPADAIEALERIAATSRSAPGGRP